MRRTDYAFAVGMLALIILAAMLSLLLGARSTSVGDVLQVLRQGPSGSGDATGSIDAARLAELHDVVWNLRVPRTLLAMTVGASLALAGAVAQSWTGNPLADPGIIGVNAGAGTAIAIGLTLGVGTTLTGRGILGLIGAVVATAVVILISRRASDPLTLVLVGLGVMLALQALTNLLALYSSRTLDGARSWAVGSTAGRDMGDVTLAAVGLILGGAVALWVARPLDLLSMGEDSAVALGLSVHWVRMTAATAIVLLAGTATAAVGMVVFVGFAAPHVVRRFAGPSLTRMLIPSALVGALAVLCADILGRFLMHPGELEMSIVIAVIGAPLMIWSVSSRRARTRGNRRRGKRQSIAPSRGMA